MSIENYENKKKQNEKLNENLSELLKIAQNNNFVIKIDIHLEREPD